ncbi:hypothetical protein ACRE_005860 [Hapsidospora chrysogenum ATCC 11550]|uniref:Uncharacterized protein n=1 Tax=Hapsidospora chrysogenum (strain ATCC 11550 / CBS 779.69 / DSM 880 / IAM 14645 / JCM 23072 / IMI 49137) TaxID=857340 RepID=A0A086TG99_HAPC1|nr:hypothetical protein ACRE_005860 [Hapsidospora chrysogenum ATCC 11550]
MIIPSRRFDVTGDTECVQGPLQWTLLLAPYVLLTTPWWLVEIPLLFTKRNHCNSQTLGIRDRLGAFFRAVAWNCARYLQPSYVAISALARSRDKKAWKVLYYFGYEPADDGSRSLTNWEWSKIAVMDGLPFALELWLVIQNAFMGRDSHVALGLGSWLLHTVPASVNGAWLIAASHTSGRLNRAHHGVACFLLLIVVGLALILTMYFTTPDSFSAMGGVLTVLYGLPMLPLCCMNCCGGRFHFFFYLYGAIARTMPFLVAIWTSHSDDDIFCFIRNGVPVFVPFIILGIAAMFVAGYCGGLVGVERYRPELSKVISSGPQLEEDDQVPLHGDVEAASGAASHPGGVDEGVRVQQEVRVGRESVDGTAPPPYKRQETLPPSYEEINLTRVDGEPARGPTS